MEEIKQKEQIRTAKDVMQSASQNYTVLYTPLAEKVLARHSVTADNKYSYCPFCVRVARLKGQDYKSVCKPLWVVTYKRLYQMVENTGRVFIEKEYQCPVCKDAKGNPRVITVEDFEKAYCEEYKAQKEIKLNIPLTVEEIRKAGFENYGM